MSSREAISQIYTLLPRIRDRLQGTRATAVFVRRSRWRGAATDGGQKDLTFIFTPGIKYRHLKDHACNKIQSAMRHR